MLFKKFVLKALLLLAVHTACAEKSRLTHEIITNSAHKALTALNDSPNPPRLVETSQYSDDSSAEDRTKVNNIKEGMDDHTKINLLIWAFVAVFIVSKVFLGRMIWLKSKLNKAKLKAVEAEAALLAEQQETERQKIESQTALIEEKEREMVAIALKMAHNNDRLHDIVALIEQKKISTLAEAKAEINKLISQDDFWNYFDLRFTQLHPDFKARLSETHPDLSKSEVDFCCLLRLNLSNKEISSLLSISYESVISKRYRIRKKMGLNEEEDLNALLEAI